jgi:hypothetical protein
MSKIGNNYHLKRALVRDKFLNTPIYKFKLK